MIVAGFGIRASATETSLREVLALTGADVQLLAVVEDKAESAALRRFAQQTGLPLRAIPVAEILTQAAQTLSPHQPTRYGTKSVAEAAALAAAGPGAALILPRITSPDGKATVAIAEGKGA